MSQSESARHGTVQRFLIKALGGENHPDPRVINSDKHAAHPPAIAVLQGHRPFSEMK
jgi:hypothetical protein